MKQILKNIIATVTYYLRIWPLFYVLSPIFRRKYLLGVIGFHRIIPSGKTKGLAAKYDLGQNNRAYEVLLKELNKYFDFVSLDEYLKFVVGENTPKKHTLLLTFDDADFDFIEYALPVLEKHQWPAVIFAPTDFIDTSKRFWHLRISNIMQKMNDIHWQKIRCDHSVFSSKFQDIISKYQTYDKSLYIKLCREIINGLDTLKDDEIIKNIKRLEQILGDSYDLDIKCLGWDQLRELEKKNIAIESHAVTHRKLGRLEANEIVSELTGSLETIENKLSKNVKALCYPAGSYDKRVMAIAKQTGYKVAFTTEHGLTKDNLDGLEFFKIPRIFMGETSKYEINLEIGRLLFKN